MTLDPELYDEREAKLPVWARTLLSDLRSHLAVEMDRCTAAEEAAEAAAGKHAPESARVRVSVGDTVFGLPDDATVDFGDVSVSFAKSGGVFIETVGCLMVLPEHGGAVRVAPHGAV